MRILRSVTTVLTVLFCVASAEASPITGGFSIIGNLLPVNGQTGASSSLGSATGLDFLSFFAGSTPSPGTPGTVFVNQANGSFASMQGSFLMTVTDFSFAGPGSANFPVLPIALFALPSFNNLTFTLNSVAIGPLGQSDTLLSLVGQGMFSMNGSSAPGTFNLSANAANGTFSFSASNGVQVPEPASLVLLGGGLLVSAGVLSRRRRRTSR